MGWIIREDQIASQAQPKAPAYVHKSWGWGAPGQARLQHLLMHVKLGLGADQVRLGSRAHQNM